MKRSLLGIIVFLALFTTALVSQNRASVWGTVTDPAGATVAQAPLELKLTATGQVYTAVSAANGQYEFASLPAGAFELTASVPGFKKYSVQFNLSNGQRLRHDVRLEVGTISESVIINGAPSDAAGGKGGGAGGRPIAPPPVKAAPQSSIAALARDAR